MKTTTRRNVASLTFIAVLAVVYAVILLAGRRGDTGDTTVGRPLPAKSVSVDKVPVPRHPAADDILFDEGRDQAGRPGRAPRRNTRQGRQRATYPDRPGVFDEPVPLIEGRR